MFILDACKMHTKSILNSYEAQSFSVMFCSVVLRSFIRMINRRSIDRSGEANVAVQRPDPEDEGDENDVDGFADADEVNYYASDPGFEASRAASGYAAGYGGAYSAVGLPDMRGEAAVAVAAGGGGAGAGMGAGVGPGAVAWLRSLSSRAYAALIARGGSGRGTGAGRGTGGLAGGPRHINAEQARYGILCYSILVFVMA